MNKPSVPGRARILAPTYNEFAPVLASAGWHVEEVGEVEALAGADLAVVVNPNNPDGRQHEPVKLSALLSRVKRLVIDESFADAVADHPLVRLISLMDHSPGVGQYANLEFYRNLYRDNARFDAKLWVVPANMASYTDIDALVSWVGAEQTESLGPQSIHLKDAQNPTLLFPFAAGQFGSGANMSFDTAKLRALGWSTQKDFEDGLRETVEWYRDNRAWWEPIKSGEYRAYYERQYAERLANSASV